MRAAVDTRVLTFAAGVPERLRLEFLIGVQDAIDGEVKFNAWRDLTCLAARLGRIGVESVLELDHAPAGSTGAEMLLKRIQWSVEKCARRSLMPSSRGTCGGWGCCAATARGRTST